MSQISLDQLENYSSIFNPSVFGYTRTIAQQLITNFQNGHGFGTIAGSTLTANDTSTFVRGTQCASVLSGGGGVPSQLRKIGGTSYDLTNQVIRVILKCDSITHSAAFNFYAGKNSFADSWKWQLQPSPSGNNTDYITSGDWIICTLSFHDAIVTGAPDVKNITDWKFEAYDDNTGNSINVHYQAIETIPDGSTYFPNGVVTICFDDNFQLAFTNGKPRLDLYGYKASMFIIQDQLGQGNRLTQQQVTDAQDILGWEACSHAYLDADHASTYPNLSANQMDYDAREMKAYGVANNFKGVDLLAYPLGAFNSTVIKEIKRYYGYARTTYSKMKETIFVGDPYRLRAISGISTFAGGYSPTTITQAGGDLDLCKTNKSWLILVFHKVTSGAPAATTEIAQTDFNTIIDAINSKGIPVRMMGEVLRIQQSGASNIDSKLYDANGNPYINSTATLDSVDYLNVTNAATANPATVIVGPTGTDTNVNLNIASKGSGVVEANGVQVADLSSTQSLSNKTIILPVRSVTSNFTFALTDNTVECNTTTGAITGTLPTASSSTGQTFTMTLIAGSNSGILSAHAGDLIAGSLTWTFNNIGSSLSVRSDGTGWCFI